MMVTSREGSYFTVEFSRGQVIVEFQAGGPVTSIRFDRSSSVTACSGSHHAEEWFREYFSGGDPETDVELDMTGSPPFHRKVWNVVREIRRGQTMTYGQVAARAGSPGAARAVGQAMAKNRFPLVVPCHRVLSSGGIGGFSSGLDLKRWLLDLERQGP
jgi:methylated-DNA-[protein]-cysteine S-methyltransferase